MPQPQSEQAQTPNIREEFNEALSSGTLVHARRMLNGLSPGDIADFIEATPPRERSVLWHCIEDDVKSDVITELNEEIAASILKKMDADEVVAITDGLESDDLADILQQLPERVTHEVLDAMSDQDRFRVERVLSYGEETAGGLMNTDTITVRPPITLDVVLRYLRRHEDLPAMTDSLFVVNSSDEFIGILPISRVLTSDGNITVREVMQTDVVPIPADMPDDEVASLFEKNDWVSAPVVDQNNVLLGRITIDDVLDVIIEDADHSLMSMAGLVEDADTFAPVLKSIPRRAIWLGVNLITVLMAAGVIKQFQAVIEQLAVLAILMPIVPSMGGIAGSQTLTLVIRGIAMGQIGKNNAGYLLFRELMLGLINGLLFATFVGVIAYWIFDDYRLGIIIAFAMVITLVTAAFCGAVLPAALKRINIDPALAGGVVLTTVTDVMGFLSLLGLATLFYL